MLFSGYGQNFEGLIPTTDFGTPTVVPKFVSRGHLYKAIVGDTIELPCKVQNLGKFSIIFWEGTIKIFLFVVWRVG